MSTQTDTVPGPDAGKKTDAAAPAAEPLPEATSPSQPAASPVSGAQDQNPIELARALAQQKSVERLQRRVEALEAAAAAEPVTAPSPLV